MVVITANVGGRFSCKPFPVRAIIPQNRQGSNGYNRPRDSHRAGVEISVMKCYLCLGSNDMFVYNIILIGFKVN